ncbi:CapA family protein [Halalkalicoccus subterraneus]|uniref:CapA family protein n=1 Tax=Halalkalicoccus subterraneus TaxID=2675002 RepID=UPI000EFA78A7|nr:CapA family protein [Halalkalicoccus subterraneus]
MGSGFNRRAVLGGLGTGLFASTAGCVSDLGLTDRGADSEESLPDSNPVSGTVITQGGDPITDATITAIREGDTTIADTTTDQDGSFSIDLRRPVWLRIEHEEYLTEMQAVGPGETVTQTVTEREGAVSLQFAGDVMFGRRFYEPNHDSLSPRYQINPETRLEDHREILQGIQPFLAAGDITSINLETPLTTTDLRHPEKTFSYVSHPVAAQVLAEAGVEYTALGNNHVFDALDIGLEDTIDSLDEHDIAYSGAGFSSDEAWEPAYIEENGLTVAYISCTTIVGESVDIDWSADQSEKSRHRFEHNGEQRTIPASVGVAEPTTDRLQTAVQQATENADAVVVQIHGGDEYVRDPDERIRTLSEEAIEAGADLVVNHHPHVTGGIEPYEDGTIAWSVGNFVFDQELWETLDSYVFTAHVTADGVVETSIEPLLLEGYLPKGIIGRPRDHVLQTTAGHSPDTVGLSEHQLWTTGPAHVSDETPSTNQEQRSFEGTEAIYTQEQGWIEEMSISSGDAQLGRDRLLTGDFEDTTIDGQRFEGPLWRYGRESDPTITPNTGHNGHAGARLTRHEGNEDRALLSPRYRLPVLENEQGYTLNLLYQYSENANFEILVSWYGESRGNSFTTESLEPDSSTGEWHRLVWHLDPPTNAEFIDMFFFLEPPEEGGVREVLLDDIRLIEWADPSISGGHQYDHLYLDGEITADLKANQPSVESNQEISWSPLAEETSNPDSSSE